MRHSPPSFDRDGFFFALKCGSVLMVLFIGVHFGTALASDIIFEKTSENATLLDSTLKETAEKTHARSEGEVRLLRGLGAFEDTLATHTLGTASIETLSQSHERMIGADLSAMKLYVYEKGYAVKTFDILSKGKRASQWETPTGLYKIETREVDHFSSIGAVHMPYSMQFFGNFFIHGWPYYPDGTSVPEGYSGGCIRLSTKDAEEVFTFATEGTPLFVWNSNGENTGSLPHIVLEDRTPPQVSAESYIVANIQTGEVYAEQHASEPRPIASLTKLITALVANETIHFGRTLTVTPDDRTQTEGTPGSIAPHDVFTVGDLLYPLLMESNNAVAYTLSRYFGSENFLRWMNDKAKAIGMENTSFEDPSGISEHNVASANDLFHLTRYIYTSQSYILNITRLPKKTITSDGGRDYALANFNVFVGNPHFLGGKTGYTEAARQTMTSIFELPLNARNEFGAPVQGVSATTTIAIIVLGSEDRKEDVERLLVWFKRNAHTSSL